MHLTGRIPSVRSNLATLTSGCKMTHCKFIHNGIQEVGNIYSWNAITPTDKLYTTRSTTRKGRRALVNWDSKEGSPTLVEQYHCSRGNPFICAYVMKHYIMGLILELATGGMLNGPCYVITISIGLDGSLFDYCDHLKQITFQDSKVTLIYVCTCNRCELSKDDRLMEYSNPSN